MSSSINKTLDCPYRMLLFIHNYLLALCTSTEALHLRSDYTPFFPLSLRRSLCSGVRDEWERRNNNQNGCRWRGWRKVRLRIQFRRGDRVFLPASQNKDGKYRYYLLSAAVIAALSRASRADRELIAELKGDVFPTDYRTRRG